MLTTPDETFTIDAARVARNKMRKERHKRLLRRFVLMTLVIPVASLLLVGWGIHIQYLRFARTQVIENFGNEVHHHLKIIDLFLKEHSAKLQLVARTQTRDGLRNPAHLKEIFDTINRDYAALNDIGVIDHAGRHVAYIGPYGLVDKNYAETFWFQQVMQKGIFISDMFMGLRQEPHFIMAVVSHGVGDPWILRATIDTHAFRSLVETMRIGRTGEVYLLNEEGFYQTPPRLGGDVMAKASLPVLDVHEGVRVRVLDLPESFSGQTAARKIVATAWLKEPRWLLVVTQEYNEALQSLNPPRRAVLFFLHVSALGILLVMLRVNKHMLTMTRRCIKNPDPDNESPK
jgi:two-component system, NtrC family, sensor kinase